MQNRGGVFRTQNIRQGRRSWPIMPASAGLGRGRRDQPRLEAETSMFGAGMTLPRFNMRKNARKGPSCIQHRRDLRSNKCMYERMRMHQDACSIILVL
eukprot:365752-Chlamydomonas_euryale.AAC.5